MPRSPPKRIQFRNFCFTLNNYTEEEYNEIIKWMNDMKWGIVGKELGEDKKTPHLQGAVVIGKQMDQSKIKKLPGFSRAHFEPFKGTASQNRDYCMKEGNFEEFGIPPKPGKRNDLLNVVKHLQNKGTINELAKDEEMAMTLIRYPRGVQLLESSLIESRKTPPIIIWIYGSTEIGKTYYSNQFSKYVFKEPAWMSNGQLQWFSNYFNQQCCILDDFRTNHCTFSFLLRLLDKYPFDVPFKGGNRPWIPKVIIITSPKTPQDTYDLHTEEDINQLVRRIYKIYSFPEEKPDFISFIKDCMVSGLPSILNEDTNEFKDLDEILNK